MFRRQFLCPSDHVFRVPRRPGACSDFFRFGGEQPEFASALDHIGLGHFRLAAQWFQIEDMHISCPDRLTTHGIRNCLVAPDGFCGQPGTNKSADYQAEVETFSHAIIIAVNFFARLSTGMNAGR